MRSAAFSGLLLLLMGPAAHAQFSLLPQVGFEQTKTTVNYNNLRSFSPLGVQSAPRVNLRMDYRFKGGHGPYAGVGTSPSVVAYQFPDPEMGATHFKASTGRLQWRLEGGYQYTSKPIYFKKSAPAKNSAAKPSVQKTQSNCRTYVYKSGCNSSAQKVARVKKDTRLNLRLQPSAGVAYIPTTAADFETAQTGGTTRYTYNAGNWNTAFVTGMGFELGKGQERKVSISLYYLKALGNQDEKILTTQSGVKTTVTSLQSRTSGWSMTLGLPFTLAKKKAVVAAPKAEPQKQQPQYKKCEYYRSKCGQRSSARVI